MQPGRHPNGSTRINTAHPTPVACQTLERLHAAQRCVLEALAMARESLARCEQALELLLVARAMAAVASAAFPAHCTGHASRQRDLPVGLTPRAAEILGLIAAGLSNRKIAEALCLSPRTVERHIANLYLKLDVHTKAEATAHALRNRLT